MSGFRRTGATTGANSTSDYGHSRSDGTQYQSPGSSLSKPVKPNKQPKNVHVDASHSGKSNFYTSSNGGSNGGSTSSKSGGGGGGFLSLNKDASTGHVVLNINNPFKKNKDPNKPKDPNKVKDPNKPKKIKETAPTHSTPTYSSSPSSSPSYANKQPVNSSSNQSKQPEVVKGGLHTTTYEKQPAWATAEQHKNQTGQYKDSMFQSKNNDAPSPTINKPSNYNNKPAYSSNKVEQSSFSKSYDNDTSDGGVVKCGLNNTTYEKQPAWATAEQHKNQTGQYKDSMFQSKNNDAPSPTINKPSDYGKPKPASGGGSNLGSGNPKCPYCNKTVYFAEQQQHNGGMWHAACVSMEWKSREKKQSAFSSYK